MRLPLLPPDRLNEDQRAFYDRALKQIEHGGFTAFKRATRTAPCLDLGGCSFTNRRSAKLITTKSRRSPP